MKIVALVLALLVASTASADPWRLENSYGFRSGSFHVNAIDMAKLSGHVDLGVRKGRWATYVEYSLTELGISEDTLARGVVGPSSGLVHRFGPHARYSYARSGSDRASIQLFGEVGVGLQHIRWDNGGRWTRPDLAIGIGSMTLFGGEKKHWGMTVGLRLLLSRRSDVPDDAPVMCAGPCDMATKPTGIDRSFMMDVAFHFGT